MHHERQSICVVGSGWHFTSGISYYTCRVVTALATEHDVSAILLRRLIPRRFYPGRARVGRAVNKIDYPKSVPVFNGIDWYWLPSMWKALRFLRQQSPEVVLLQWWTGAVLHTYLLLALSARRSGSRIVVEFHEVQDTGEARVRGVARYTRALASRILRHADALVVHSEHDKSAVRASYGLSDVPVEIIPHGPFDHHLETETLEKDRRDDELTTILFFGTIRPYKGLEHLVEAFNGLEEADARRMRLLVVGETWESWTAPLEAIEQSQHRDRIELVNRYVDDNEVSEVFSRADAVVLPYLRSSASGPLHIAMAYGLPTVLSDVGGLRDGAAGYEGILWVPPGDVVSLRRVLRELPSLKGRRYRDPRSWESTVAVYDRLIAEVGSA